ncbi:DgyrCDS1981 [Dimorphilus gyrociliatus]|uniref:DgyrCDS1981 n=1 Tax=Dimorphilus gyrociliatus TaxID=2664684 RepID=A0A7I8V949_9ANNE|nr:DgyrCDS1981 [Dimorphilus gyrociliatus]
MFNLNITFENLDSEVAKAKLKVVPAKSVDIKFVQQKSALLRLVKLNTKLKDGELFKNDSDKFEKLKRSQLLKELEFDYLLDKNVEFILENASLEEKDIKIKDKKNIKDMHINNSLSTLELNIFILRGIEFIILAEEKKFVPLCIISPVASLGLGQAMLGCALIITGFGASLRTAIVAEGIAHMKAVGLAISAVSMGMSIMKDDAKDKTVQKRANDIRQGKADIIAAAKRYRIILKIVDSLKYSLIREDVENKVRVIYVQFDYSLDIRDIFYVNDGGCVVEITASREINDYPFDAFSHILDKQGISKSLINVRGVTAKYMELNCNYFYEYIRQKAGVRTETTTDYITKEFWRYETMSQ